MPVARGVNQFDPTDGSPTMAAGNSNMYIKSCCNDAADAMRSVMLAQHSRIGTASSDEGQQAEQSDSRRQ